jgi:DNA-binding NarL/FixJ family response regulator
MERVRLLLVIDLPLFRESLGRQLRLESDLQVIGEYGSATEGLEALQRFTADVVLLDCGGADEAARFVTAVTETGYHGKVLVLASEKDRMSLFRPLRAGAAGVFWKHSSLDSLPRAIRQVAAGEAWIDLDVLQLLAASVPEGESQALLTLLTEREQEVLRGVLDGLTNRAIASRIGGSEGAVKAVIREVFRKAGVRTRSQLMRVALLGHGEWSEPSHTGHARD